MAGSIGIGVIGLGLHGTRYARHLHRQEVDGAHLAAVWRRDKSKGRSAATEWGARFADTIEELVACPDVEAVVAAVPAGRHAEVAEHVAAAGKPLLLEKPLGRTAEEAEAIAQRFARAKTLLTVAQTLRFDPLVTAMKNALAELGPLTGFCFEQRIEPRGLGWEDNRELAGGGVLLQTGIHTFDALRVVTGATEVGILSASVGRRTYRNVEDHALVVLELTLPGGDRVLGHLASSKIGGSRHMRFAAYGERGGVEADFIGRRLVRVIGREQRAEDVPEAPTVVALTRAFVAAARNEGPNPVPAAEGVTAVRLVGESYRRAGVS